MFFILHETNPETLCMTHVHTRIYPCKMLTFWYTGYDELTVHVQIHASITHQHVHVHCTHTFPTFS